MQRLCLLAAMLLLSTPADAGGSISFSVGGHRIHIGASRHCRSISCASISVSGIHVSRRRRYHFDDDDVAPANPGSPQPQPVLPAPAARPNVPTIVASAPPAVHKPAAMTAQAVAAPPPPAVTTVQPTQVAAPRVEKVSFEVEDTQADTPLGDWRTEGTGAIRIARCGDALCGYMLDPSLRDRGEVVLINMKPKTARHWTGGVYSRSSGETYYGTMALKGSNRLHVEACVLGRFYCSGNNWSRIDSRAESLVSSRLVAAAPRS